MKKSLKIIFIMMLLAIVILPVVYSKAVVNMNSDKTAEDKKFFEISKLEITKKDKIEMVLNIDMVKFNEFVFELKSDENLKNIEIIQNDKIETEKSNNEIVMDISKEKTNIRKINFYYSIPDNKKVGDTIKFTATVTSVVKNEEKVDNSKNEKSEVSEKVDDKLQNGPEENKVENTKQKSEIQSIEFEVKIIEDDNNSTQKPNIEESKENNNNSVQVPNTDGSKENSNNIQAPNTDGSKENDKQNLPIENNVENNKNPTNNEQESNKTNTMSPIKGTPQNVSNIQYSGTNSVSFNSSQTVKTVTYNGSDNNYLSNLLVEGYNLNKEYSKDNSTYFMTVESDIDKLNITASAEESSAKVCVYGNENLKEGTNKILISVTAENGNVRNYRIYVTKKA